MLLGRDAERARLNGLLERARGGASAALVIRGEPGIGKSALLEDAVAAADGMTVLRARGVESESELSFAGLADLLGPVVSELGSLPPPQRVALAGALALGPPVPGDRFTLYAAALSLLATVAERAPVLVAVDDAPWLDAPSREALVFVARRLQEEGVVLLLAARSGEPVGSEPAGVAELVLDGLDAGASAALLEQAGAIAPEVAGRLFDATGGNPLALLELSRLLNDAQRSGAEPIEEPVPVGAGIERAFSHRIDALPAASRQALAMAAASESGALDELAAAGLDLNALEPAEAAGLIAVADGRLTFRHSLLRSVAYRAVPAPEQRAAHRAIAAALEGERRAWHLAAAAVAPDEEVAAALAEAAGAARARGGPAAAMRAAERAARLTPEPRQRAGRLLEAAGDCARVGRPDRAQELLAEALELAEEPRLRADVQHMRALIEARSGAAAAAAELLGEEAARVEAIDPVRAATMTMAAVQPLFEAGENATGLATAQRGQALAERAELPPMPAGLPLAMALLLCNERPAAQPMLHGAVDWLDHAEDPWALGPVLIFGIGQAFMWMEDHDRSRRLLESGIAQSRAWSAPGLMPYGLLCLCELEFRSGRWAHAYAAGTEAVRLAEETGQLNDKGYSLAVLARVEAALGHEKECRAHMAGSLEIVDLLGAEIVRGYVASTLGLLELGHGRSEEAAVALEGLAGFLGERPAGDPAVMQWPPDLVEAHVRLGRREDAEAVLAPFERAARHSGSRWASAAAARCRGLLAPDDAFDEPFREALEHRAMPFETARTQLVLGERLRRAGRRVEARGELRDALATFERLGAQPWAERARTELRASGERVRRGSPTAAEQLTPQELQVALEVARGSTNREAAAALFLSPKTIEFHLRNIYRKLGIRSRTELVRLVLSDRPDG
jgi:DNA-binding CsgD family transcriptional regulator